MTGKIALMLGVFAVAYVQVQGDDRLIWADEFDYLDEGKWSHMVTGWDGGNGEFQYYRNNRKNSFTKNGRLFIRPTPVADEIPDLVHGTIDEPGCNMEPCVVTADSDIINPYFSARLTSRNSFSALYGRIEILAKMPTGDWLWPAISMLPTDEFYGSWPRSGEIDIAELRGNPDLRSPDGVNHGITEVGSSLHFGPSWNDKATLNKKKQAPRGKSWSDDFHTYELIWTRELMKTLVDGQVIHEYKLPWGGFKEIARLNSDIYRLRPKEAPFDQRFHFVFSVAVGGGSFPPDWRSSGRSRPWWGGDVRRQFWNSRGAWQHTWGSPDQHSMQIEYIRVFE